MKKIYAINASPRKGWNTAQMLDRFLDGVRSRSDRIEILRIDLYDLDFKGCRGCLSCRLKTAEKGFCAYPDGATELLREIKRSDGFVFAAPIYYGSVPSQMRGLMERLFYPGTTEKEIPVRILYTLNQPQENMEKFFRRHLNEIKSQFGRAFQTNPEEVFAFETLHWDHPERYEMPMEFYEARVARKAEKFPQELENAFESGVRFAGYVLGEE